MEISVTIENFRSIGSTTLTLRNGINILIGPNGAGETYLLTGLERGAVAPLRKPNSGGLKPIKPGWLRRVSGDACHYHDVPHVSREQTAHDQSGMLQVPCQADHLQLIADRHFATAISLNRLVDD